MKIYGLLHVFCGDVLGGGDVGYGSGYFEAGRNCSWRKAVAQSCIIEHLTRFCIQRAKVQNLLRRKTCVFNPLTFSLSFNCAGYTGTDFFGGSQARAFFYFYTFVILVFYKYAQVYAVKQRCGKFFPVLID